MFEPAESKRQAPRKPVLRAAKIVFGASVVDCLVLDVSDAGVRVRTELPMPLPEEVTVEFHSGGTWHARRRWQRGDEAGLELTRFAGLSGRAAVEAAELYRRLRDTGLQAVADKLAEARHFDHPGIESAMASTLAAVHALQEVMRAALGIKG